MRAFIAVDLPEAIKAAIAEEQRALRSAFPSSSRHDDIRWTRPEGIHLTLKFLGEISDKQTVQVSRALEALGSFESFFVEVKAFGFFPDARRPRVFWVGVQASPVLAQLAERVDAAMEQLGFAPEGRTFSPHLTLARFKAPKPQPELLAALEPRRGFSLGRFQVSEFFLFESKLSPQGAQYRRLARFPRSSSAGT